MVNYSFFLCYSLRPCGELCLKNDSESTEGKKLLAHELAHVVQQSKTHISKIKKNNLHTITKGRANEIIQRSPESNLVDQHTSLGDLNEESLGFELLSQAQQGNFDFVQRTLNELGSTDRDDVSYGNGVAS